DEAIQNININENEAIQNINMNEDSCELPNANEFLVSSKNNLGVVYNVNSDIGTCSCSIGMMGAPCKHQGAIAMKYHIKLINFLLSLTPEDHMIFAFVTSGVNSKNCSFYASLHTKAVQKNSKADEQNNKNEIETDNVNNLSFDKFLEEISDDYKNCGSQLRKAFETFAKRYRASKSRSIVWAITFLYNSDFSTQIKSGAAICIQPESVKRRKTGVRNNKRAKIQYKQENIFQEIPKLLKLEAYCHLCNYA
ncbi:21672_t:CDS:2, partial [Dentiscutata erythropus]